MVAPVSARPISNTDSVAPWLAFFTHRSATVPNAPEVTLNASVIRNVLPDLAIIATPTMLGFPVTRE